MPHRRPHGHQCVNVHHHKVSSILLKRFIDFPLVDTSANPAAGTITGATCTDDDNSLAFDAFPVHQGPNAATAVKRLGIKLYSQTGIGGGGPLDGLLTITLLISNGFGGTTPTPPIDVPVEYVDDPSAPTGP